MIKVIYHNNCFDGICAAWVVHKALKDYGDPNEKIEFIPANYNDSRLMNAITQDCYENANINDKYIIVDFSFPRELMQLMASKAEMLVLDHHKTSEEACKGLPFCHFDMNESGASLAWKYYYPNEPLPNLVKYIRDRDLWLFKEPCSEDINSYIQSYPMTIENYDNLSQELDQDAVAPLIKGQAINRYKQTMVETMCKNAAYSRDWPFYDNRVPVVNASMLFSEVGNELCKKFPSAPFAAYYFDRLKDNKRQWGLRSIGDFDASKVAKTFGGGGHKNAAGFEQDLSAI